MMTWNWKEESQKVEQLVTSFLLWMKSNSTQVLFCVGPANQGEGRKMNGLKLQCGQQGLAGKGCTSLIIQLKQRCLIKLVGPFRRTRSHAPGQPHAGILAGNFLFCQWQWSQKYITFY
jgi:hypothetical protein